MQRLGCFLLVTNNQGEPFATVVPFHKYRTVLPAECQRGTGWGDITKRTIQIQQEKINNIVKKSHLFENFQSAQGIEVRRFDDCNLLLCQLAF